MSSVAKRLAKFLKNPTSAKYPEVEYVLTHSGFEKVSVKGGSHLKFKHPLLPEDLIIPVHNNECKNFYKRAARKLLKELKKQNK